MEERRLQVFRTVARELSFSRAGLALHLSQSAVSQQIAALEQEVGGPLFDRSRRRIRLTPAGAALLNRVDALLGDFAEARRAVAAARGAVEGDLRVAASRTVGTYLLPRPLAALGRRNPTVRLQVSIENSEQVVRTVLSGQADVGYVEDAVQNSAILLTPLLEDELLVVAPAAHRFAEVPAVAPEDLAAEPWIVRERGSGTRRASEEHLLAAGVPVAELNVVAELSGIEVIKAAVEAGLGISILSSASLTKERALGTLVARPLAGVRIRRSISAVAPIGGTELPAARQLTSLLATVDMGGGAGHPAGRAPSL
ncbi:MAG TPA: LysR family transcriptional regulator [Solirubrobacteraceae bacterium]|nr:LysR family transcriptional regulator [Solirubrobacteraceae bacterium]